MVLARVNRVRGRGVDVGVCVVYGKDGEGEGTVCGEEWQGVIRREDVRATEKDKVVCGEGFRVGDVVRGVVVCAFNSNFLFLWLCLFFPGGGGEGYALCVYLGESRYLWKY